MGNEERPAELLRDFDLRYVPNFIVRRDSRELGRMVELPPNGIERDLLRLLGGATADVVPARDDLGPADDDG